MLATYKAAMARMAVSTSAAVFDDAGTEAHMAAHVGRHAGDDSALGEAGDDLCCVMPLDNVETDQARGHGSAPAARANRHAGYPREARPKARDKRANPRLDACAPDRLVN